MGILGKVTGDLEAPRGPDVTMNITVPARWFGQQVVVRLPRNLHCAICKGGGCDCCDRAGAVSLRSRDEGPVSVAVQLPSSAVGERSICLRIPEQGGPAEVEELGRGHLLLCVSPGEVASPEVSLTSLSTRTDHAERISLMKKSITMAVVLIALFLGMLRLSGWL